VGDPRVQDQRRGTDIAEASHRSALRSRVRKVLAVVAVLVTLFVALTARVLIWPIQGAPARVDAIVMLAGPGNRLPAALLLAREHRAPVLVVSRGWMGYGGPCPAPVSEVRTICFEPNPGNTRGEAEYVAALAKREGWHSLLIVATRPQAVRSQLLFGRCFIGQVYVSTASIPASSWPYQIAYGWGALIKAVVLTRSC
jgi:uncharacterized SAM-binding protein YcdF (DUF218 family)